MVARKPGLPPTLSLTDAARMLGYSKNVGYGLANRGEFPGAFRLPHSRKWRVSRAALDAFLANPSQADAPVKLRPSA
jgi:predicted DNA-binding transcriptional regulator AlpA